MSIVAKAYANIDIGARKANWTNGSSDLDWHSTRSGKQNIP
jgi:hypothetical protein